MPQSVSSYMVAGKYCPLSTIFSLPHTCISRQEELAADMNTPVDAQSSQGDQLYSSPVRGQIKPMQWPLLNSCFSPERAHLPKVVPKVVPILSIQQLLPLNHVLCPFSLE